jgi:hypothetical protein
MKKLSLVVLLGLMLGVMVGGCKPADTTTEMPVDTTIDTNVAPANP